ncbi:MAG: hypothetical protein ACRCWW_11395 [Scandinavium sp.]|uniref:hypothetical protein n=1 Tax=Scandinavium sp. TaxID=2830653 RepID=UPI003F3668AE
MEAPAVWTHPLMYVEVEPESNFIGAIKHCENLAATALDEENMLTQQALYLRLHQCLSQLHPVLNDPIPEAQVEQFTASVRPEISPSMDTESDLLCEYCIALSELLSGSPRTLRIDETLQGLLYDLTSFLADIMQAPRWLKTPEGLHPLG